MLTKDGEGNPIQVMRPVEGRTQLLNVTTGTVQSAAFQAEVIRIVSTVNCQVRFGVNPTATGSDMIIPAFSVEYLTVVPGHKISIKGNSAGPATVTEMA